MSAEWMPKRIEAMEAEIDRLRAEIDRWKLIASEHERTPCPYVRTSDEGTSYCSLGTT